MAFREAVPTELPAQSMPEGGFADGEKIEVLHLPSRGLADVWPLASMADLEVLHLGDNAVGDVHRARKSQALARTRPVRQRRLRPVAPGRGSGPGSAGPSATTPWSISPRSEVSSTCACSTCRGMRSPTYGRFRS